MTLTAFTEDDVVKSPAIQRQRSKHGTHKKEEEESAHNTSTTTETEPEGETTTSEEKAEPVLPRTLFYIVYTALILFTELDEETKTQIVESEPFKDFFDKTTRIMDRALYLSEALDIMEDYKSVDEQAYVADTIMITNNLWEQFNWYNTRSYIKGYLI